MSNPKSEATSLVAPLDRTFPPEPQYATTLRSKFRGFPWRIFLITSLLPLSLAPIILLSSIAEAASQNYIRGRA